MKTIPKAKWMEIYSSLKLIKFYSFAINQSLILSARYIYQHYNLTNFPNDGEKNDFDNVPNSLSFVYLLIARTNEIMVRYLDDELPTVQDEIWDRLKINLGITTFEDILVKFQITVVDNNLPDKWKNEKDSIKFFGLISNIRNSISHWRYSIEEPSKIILKDRPNKNAVDNFHIEIESFQLLNFTDSTVSTIHDYLIQNRIE